jgi:hypothetical protein
MTVDQKFKELRDKRSDLDVQSQHFAEQIAHAKRKVKEETKNLQSMRRQRCTKKERDPRPLANKVNRVLTQARKRLTAAAFAKVEETSQFVARRLIKAQNFREKKLKKQVVVTWLSLTSEEDSDLGSVICAREHYRLQLLVRALGYWRKSSLAPKASESSILEEIDNLMHLADHQFAFSEANKLNQSFGTDESFPKSAPPQTFKTETSFKYDAPCQVVRPRLKVPSLKLADRAASTSSAADAALVRKAEVHYENSLKVRSTQYYFGLKPWATYVATSKTQTSLELATSHRDRHLKSKTINAWLAAYVQSFEESDFPKTYYDRRLLTKSLKGLQVECPYRQVIQQFRLFSLGAKVFDCWKIYSASCREQKLYDNKRAQMLTKVNSWMEGYRSSKQSR